MNGIEVLVFFNCEGNLDVCDDAFHARALYKGIIHKELWASDARHQASAVLYWSIVWYTHTCTIYICYTHTHTHTHTNLLQDDARMHHRPAPPTTCLTRLTRAPV